MHEEFRTEQFAESFIGVWKRVITDPRGFFQDMPTRGGIQAPLLFLVGCLVLAGARLPGGRTARLRAQPGLLGHGALVRLRRGLHGDRAPRLRRHRRLRGELSRRRVRHARRWPCLWVPLLGQLTLLYTLFLVIVGLERVHGFDAVKSVLTVLLASIVLVAVGWAFGLNHHGVAHGRATGSALAPAGGEALTALLRRGRWRRDAGRRDRRRRAGSAWPRSPDRPGTAHRVG